MQNSYSDRTRTTGRKNGKLTQESVVAYIVQAFNFFRAGNKLRAVSYTAGNKIVVDGLAGAIRELPKNDARMSL